MFAATVSCPSCHAELPTDACFCAACGRRVGHDPAEISWAVADRRTFGVPPGRGTLRTVRIRTVRFLGLVRAKLVLVVAVARAHLRAQRERFRLRRRAAALARERSLALERLGEATLYGDRETVKRAEENVGGLDTELQSLSEELERVERDLDARVGTVQREEGATAAVEPVPEPDPRPVPEP